MTRYDFDFPIEMIEKNIGFKVVTSNNEYLAKTPKAREFLRLAKQNNLSDKEISSLILSINQNPAEEDLML